MNQPYESAKALQQSFPARTNQTAEQELLELLAFSIIDIPMMQRRKEIASRVARCFAGYLRHKLECFHYDSPEGRVLLYSDLRTLLAQIDGEF